MKKRYSIRIGVFILALLTIVYFGRDFRFPMQRKTAYALGDLTIDWKEQHPPTHGN